MAQYSKYLASSNVHLTNCATTRVLVERRFQDTITKDILNFRAYPSTPRLILVFSLFLSCNRVSKNTFMSGNIMLDYGALI